MRGALLTLLGWLVLVLGLVSLSRHGQGNPETRLDPTRLLTYQLSEDEPLRFAVEPGTRAIKLLTWEIRDAAWSADPRVTSTYCLEAVITDPSGAELATWRRWISARQSLGETEGFPTLPAAWLREDPALVSDDRLTLLELPAGRVGGEQLSVSSCGMAEGSEVRFVAFGTDVRSLPAQARFRRSPDTPELVEAWQRFTRQDWLDLPGEWRAHLVEERWMRLGALEPGGPIPTVELDSTFNRGSWWNAPARGIPVPPGGAVAFNLEGPTRLHFAWFDLEGERLPSQRTLVRRVHADGSIEESELGVARGKTLGESEGVRSVQLGLPAGAPEARILRAWTEGGGLDRAWGDPPRLPVDEETDHQRVGPDLRNIVIHRALPAEKGEPLRYPVSDEEHLRFRFIVPMDPELPGLLSPLPAPRPGPTVTIRALDEQGEALGSWSLDLLLQPSLFERYTQLDDPSSAAPSEPTQTGFKPPRGTVEIEVEATFPTDVLVRAETPLDKLRSIVWEGYEETEDQQAEGRYVPLVRSRWQTRAPLEREALQLSERVARLDMQVRLEEPSAEELVEATSDDPGRHSLSLRRNGRLDVRQSPVELITEPDGDGIPGPGSRVRLSTRAARVVVGPSGRLHVEHLLDADRLGEELVIEVGGRQHRLRPRTTTGILTVHGLSPGSQSVRLVSIGGRGKLGGHELLLLRTEGGSPLWANRKVRRLDPDGILEHSPLPAGPQTVSLLVYGATDLARLKWRIEGVALDLVGFLPEDSGLSGEFLLRPGSVSARLLSRGARVLQRSRRVDIPLPAGLPAGGRLELDLRGTSTPVRLRALATWSEGREDSVRHWAIDAPPEPPEELETAEESDSQPGEAQP